MFGHVRREGKSDHRLMLSRVLKSHRFLTRVDIQLPGRLRLRLYLTLIIIDIVIDTIF